MSNYDINGTSQFLYKIIYVTMCKGQYNEINLFQDEKGMKPHPPMLPTTRRGLLSRDSFLLFTGLSPVA